MGNDNEFLNICILSPDNIIIFTKGGLRIDSEIDMDEICEIEFGYIYSSSYWIINIMTTDCNKFRVVFKTKEKYKAAIKKLEKLGLLNEFFKGDK